MDSGFRRNDGSWPFSDPAESFSSVCYWETDNYILKRGLPDRNISAEFMAQKINRHVAETRLIILFVPAYPGI